jgi:gliding motility-associated-like protein
MIRFISICFILFFSALSEVWAQQPNIIYVTPGGNGTGTQASPASINFAAANAGPGKQIRLASGLYQLNSTINMTSDLTLEGGYDPTTWCKNSSLSSKIIRTNQNITTNPNRLVAISCVNITNFYIFDVEIETENAVGNGVTTYGIYLSGCSNYSIVRCKAKAGNASDGLPGTNGPQGINGASGVNGGNGCENCGSAAGRQGGAGGSGSYPGSFAGGNGGNGGQRACNNSCPGSSNGTAGQAGQGPGGAGGGGGSVVCAIASFGCDGNGPAAQGQPGQPGANGTNGADGVDGVAGFAAGFFQPAIGQNGLPGGNGRGGGGGGGGGSQSGLICLFGNQNDDGPGGAGGGEGGQGGIGATGGGGGGGSFGIFVWNNGLNGKLIDTYVESGLPGQGAQGGQQGGFGGNGGNGGPGGNRSGCDMGRGGPGGKGGNGGNGGKGGNGNPGVSFAIWEDPNGEPIQQASFAGPAEPQIVVCGLGCTYSEFTFSTNAFGFIQWFFDGGTEPLIATGPTATVHYTTPGRHTVTLVVNGLPYIYSEFVGVFQDGTPFIPDILTTDTTICPGNTAQFSSSLAGLDYRWNFQGGTPPQILGPGNQNVASTFNTTGIYWVSLQTESQTCGWSVPDSMQVNVLPVLTPEVLVTSSGAQICNGQSVTFGASPVNGGTNPQFLWFVNGVNTGFTGPVFTQNNLTAPITVTAEMNSSYACPQPALVTSLPVNVTVFPQPVLNCNFLGNYLGAPSIFTPLPAGGTGPYTFLWNFGDGGISGDSVATHQFSGTGNYPVSVTATDANGCEATCSINMNIVVAPQVDASFDLSFQTQCGSSSAQFFDSSTGNVISWFWNFGDGNTSNLQNPAHVYNSPGIYTVMLVSSNGVNFDTAYAPNAVIVEALPTAGISAVETEACAPFQVQFQDASSGATSWLWDFGDGTPPSTLQNPLHWYTDAGTYTVSLIVSNNISGCTDTITELNYILINPSPTAQFSASPTQVCTGRPVQFTDLSTGGALQWRWNFGEGTESDVQNPSHIYNSPGQYTVFLEVTGPGPTFCKDLESKPFYIQVNQTPVAAFSADPIVVQLPFNQVNFTDLSFGADFIKWNFGNGATSDIRNPVTFYPDSGQFVVTQFAGTDFGCSDTATILIVVNEQMVIYVPNAFTPDGDNINDELVIGTRGLKEFEFTIFNRWGESVFKTRDPMFFWNGKSEDGKTHPNGVYTYVLNYQYYVGPEQIRTGSILLIR